MRVGAETPDAFFTRALFADAEALLLPQIFGAAFGTHEDHAPARRRADGTRTALLTLLHGWTAKHCGDGAGAFASAAGSSRDADDEEEADFLQHPAGRRQLVRSLHLLSTAVRSFLVDSPKHVAANAFVHDVRTLLKKCALGFKTPLVKSVLDRFQKLAKRTEEVAKAGTPGGDAGEDGGGQKLVTDDLVADTQVVLAAVGEFLSPSGSHAVKKSEKPKTTAADTDFKLMNIVEGGEATQL